jgi:DNA-binding cell septation regulator SpoVG
MNFTARVNPIRNPRGKTVAMASLIIDGVVSVDGFSVLSSDKGFWVSSPSRKTNKQDENGKDIWRDNVWFNEEKAEGQFHGPVRTAAYEAILAEWTKVRSLTAQPDRTQTASTPRPADSGTKPAQASTRGPLGW